MTQTDDNLKRIRYRCHRGMLELDLYLLRFFDAEFVTLTPECQQKFIDLLQEQDPDLFAWLMGHREPDSQYLELINLIRSYHVNLGDTATKK